MANEQDKLRSGNHDGIEEYDNDLPRWWLYLFYITIVFGIGYVAYYHVFKLGDLQEAGVAKQMEVYNRKKAEYAAVHEPKQLGESEMLALAVDPALVAKGRAVFVARCTPCHGQNAEGIIGPNLTDKYWIHGGKITEIKTTVQNGVIEKGMPVWKTMISHDDIDAVVTYIWSIRGSNPPNPKAPQGNLVE